MLGCLKCGRPYKGHPLPYGTNCALALAEEHADKSREITARGMEGPVVPTQLGPSALGKHPAVDNAAPVPVEHCITLRTGQLNRRQHYSSPLWLPSLLEHQQCSLAVLSTWPGQQDEQSAKDRHQIDELSQQLSDTTTQIAHISKVLDCLLTSHNPTATLPDAPAAPITSAGHGAIPLGAASSLLQQGTASSEIHSTASGLQVNGQAAPHSHAEVWQDQVGPAQTQVYNSALSHYVRPFFPSDFLTQFPVSLGAPAQDQHLALNQQQHPQATITTGLSGTAQHNTLDGPLYSNIRPGLVTLLAMGPLPGISQTTTNATSMATDIATMAKVIPNVPVKLQQKIIQGEFIDLSELLQTDFQFKYASIDSNDAFELVHKDETMLMWPRKKCRQIDCLNMWLSAWAL